MFRKALIICIFLLISITISHAKNETTINSITSLQLFVDKAIKKGVIPKQLSREGFYGVTKFEEIDFNFRTVIRWTLDSQCPSHKDEIIDATKGKNHSIECNSGDTIIVTGDGDDWIDDASGNDVIYTGKGNDAIDSGSGSDILIFEKGWGHDKVKLNGFEVAPTAIIGNDNIYHWKYSSFVVFGEGISPEDIRWKENSLINSKTGDSIAFSGNMNFNVVFMSAPQWKFQNQPKLISLSNQKVESLEAYGDILYLSRGNAGVDIVDVKNIIQPLLLSHIDLPGRVSHSKRHKNLLFVAQSDADGVDKKGWISIVDVTNPVYPKHLSSIKYGGAVYDFLIENGKLIIVQSDRVDSVSTIHIVDITNPSKPRELVSTDLKVFAQSIMVHNDWLWVACVHGCGVYGYDLKNIKKLKNKGHFTIDKKWIYQIQKDKNIVAVYVGSCKPVISFFSDHDNLSKGLVSSIIKEEEMQHNDSFLLKDNYLFLPEGKKGVYIYNLTDVSKPVIKQIIDFEGRYIKRVTLSGNRLYVVDGDGAIHVKELDGLFAKRVNKSNEQNEAVVTPDIKDKHLSQDQLLTLLYKAIDEDNAAEMTKLIDRGAPFMISGHGHGLPIESAAGSGKIKVLKVLLDRGVNPNVNFGHTIILAALYEQDEALRLLSKYGGDMTAKDKDDECTALHYIAQDGEVETAKFLISKGADINAMCRRRETPLTWATFGKNQPMTDFLKSLEK